ncbi:MAG: hypothetical protein ACF787_00885, partial [Rhodopirellula sp. JB053]
LPAHARLLNRGFPLLLIEIIWRPIVFGILLSVVLYVMVGWFGEVSSWRQLCVVGFFSGLANAVCFPVLLSAGQLSDLRQRVKDRLGKRREATQS